MEKWYQSRRDILARRAYWAPHLEVIWNEVQSYFNDFEPDPLTGSPVFTIAFGHPDTHPGGLITVTPLIERDALQIGLPALSLNLLVTPVPKLARDSGGTVSGIKVPTSPDRFELEFRIDKNTTHPLHLRPVLGEYVQRTLS